MSKSIPKYELQQLIEANYKLGGKYFPGKIKKIHEIESIGEVVKYDIIYDDGEAEYRVEERDIRLAGETKNSSDERNEEFKSPTKEESKQKDESKQQDVVDAKPVKPTFGK